MAPRTRGREGLEAAKIRENLRGLQMERRGLKSIVNRLHHDGGIQRVELGDRVKVPEARVPRVLDRFEYGVLFTRVGNDGPEERQLDADILLVARASLVDDVVASPRPDRTGSSQLNVPEVTLPDGPEDLLLHNGRSEIKPVTVIDVEVREHEEPGVLERLRLTRRPREQLQEARSTSRFEGELSARMLGRRNGEGLELGELVDWCGPWLDWH